FARLQGPELRPRLVELALQGLQPGLEFILPQLADQLALGDLLSLFDRQLDKQAGHLEGEFDPFRGFDLSGEGPNMNLFPGRHDHRLDGAGHVGGGRSRRRTPRGEKDDWQSDRHALTAAPATATSGVHDRFTSPGMPFGTARCLAWLE